MKPRRKSKLFFFVAVGAFVFVLFSSVSTYSTYQNKAKQQAAQQQEKAK